MDLTVKGADQLLLYFVLAENGCFRTLPLAPHSLTNVEVIGMFLDTRIVVADGVRCAECSDGR